MTGSAESETPPAPAKRRIDWMRWLPYLVACLLWAWQAHPYLNVANDAGRYMVLGESLALTGEMRLLNDARQPLDTLYPPGFPALIAFWIKATGRDPGGVVLLVKFTQLLFLLASIPLLRRLLTQAQLPPNYVQAATLTFALSPAVIAYANEVMSEMPLLFCCLAALVLVERNPRVPFAEDTPKPWKVGAAVLLGGLAFLIRTAGATLLLSLLVWFGYRAVRTRKIDEYGFAAFALVILLAFVGTWQVRNSRIIRQAPPDVKYATYLDQFTYRNPDDPNAGRITLSPRSLLRRAVEGFIAYLGMTPRALLHSMSVGTIWFPLFYVVVVPLGVAMFVGFAVGWRRELWLSGGFCAVFWLFAVMWPWRNPRFVVPLLPLLLLYAALAVHWAVGRYERRIGKPLSPRVPALAVGLLWLYFIPVHLKTARAERRPTLAGYALGRSKEEAGFYAACGWLKQNAEEGAVVMGRPAYLLHLYSGRPTTQIEPSEKPRVQEVAYMQKRNVRYLVQDRWSWSRTDRFIAPYLRVYGDLWKLAWEDPNGSGVKVWRRNATP